MIEVRFLVGANEAREREESNRKGVGKTSVFPWRKESENRGFPRREIAKRPRGSINRAMSGHGRMAPSKG